MVIMYRISDISTFDKLGLIFKVAFYTICPWLFQIWFIDGYQIWTEFQTYDLLLTLAKVTVGLNIWKYCVLQLMSMIFPWRISLMAFRFEYGDHEQKLRCNLKILHFALWVHDISKSIYHQWHSNSDVLWPWTKSQMYMYQLLVTMAKFSRSQQD